MSALTTSTSVKISEEALTSLRTQVRGEVILPGEPKYDQASQVYNGMIHKYPAVIVRCKDAADVITAVNFARQHALAVAVRGGGHNGPGFGTVDDGLVIDLCDMRSVRVDPADTTVRVEGGALLGDVDHATHPFNLAVPFGFVSTNGVGGLTLGGGIGYLARKYGLSIDSLLSVDMVLADGSFITASEKENEDLFWAVRGGGGNFGVVTSFLFRGNPLPAVYGGPIFWPMEAANTILHKWQELILNAPDDLNGWFGFVTVPPVAPFPEQYQMKKMCVIVWCYTGPQEKAAEVFRPIRSFSPPAIDVAGPIPFPVLQSLFDALFPPGQQWYWKADFFDRYDDRMIDLHLKYAQQLPTPSSTMHIYPINGAAGRVGKQETAWGYRDANFAQVIVAVDPDPANNERMIQWAKDYYQALHPYSLGGGYVNMIMDEGTDRVQAAYGENYARLAQIKARYDPQNFFHVNQNIAPQA
ncbi:MAG: FAD-binding oxidoreductase [Omnitrophica WOR_2 bacterium]